MARLFETIKSKVTKYVEDAPQRRDEKRKKELQDLIHQAKKEELKEHITKSKTSIAKQKLFIEKEKMKLAKKKSKSGVGSSMFGDSGIGESMLGQSMFTDPKKKKRR